MSKICMVTTDHSPMDDRIYFKEALSLKASGNEVSIVCGADPKGVIRDLGGMEVLNPDGKSTLDLDGIKVQSIPKPGSFYQRYMNKIFRSSFFIEFIRKAVAVDADVYHAHEPFSLYIAMQVQKQTGAKVVFDSHESWRSGSPKEMYIKKRFVPHLKYLITANQITRGSLLHLNKDLHTEVIYNCADPVLFGSEFNQDKLSEPIIVHEGAIPFNRGLKEIIEMLKMLKKDIPDIKLRIVGEAFGEEKDYLAQQILNHDLQNNLEETGWLPYKEVGAKLKDCSIGLITKTATDNNILGGPAIKLFNYFAFGIAIVDVDLPESTRFLDETGAGVTVHGRSPEALYEVVKRLLDDKALLLKYCENSFKAFNTYNWELESKKLITFYNDVVLSDKEIYYR